MARKPRENTLKCRPEFLAVSLYLGVKNWRLFKGLPLVTSETFTSNCVDGHTRSGSESEVEQGLQPGPESPRSPNESRGAVSTPNTSQRLGCTSPEEDNIIQSIHAMSSIQSENTRHVKN